MRSDWTLRVPVIRPRFVARFDVAAGAAAAVALAVSLGWLGLPVPGGLAAGLALLAVCRLLARRAGNASALLVARDGAFHVRLRQGWQPLELQRAWRGPRWLTLRGTIPAAECNYEASASAGKDRYVTLTLWQDALGSSAWRRACLLAGRRMRRVASRSVAEPL